MPVPGRDLLLAVALAAVVQIDLALKADVPADARVISTVAALSVFAVVERRRHPVAVIAVIVGTLVIDVLVGGVLVSQLDSPPVVLAVVSFAVGAHAVSPVRIVAAIALAVAGMTAANQLAPDVTYSALDDLAFFAILLVTPALLGRLLRRRMELIGELERRSAELRRARDDEAVGALAEERARLAIALHATLAHRVAEISLQASGATRVAADDPARAREALASIERTARSALDDIREVIGVLRRGDGELALAPHRAHPAQLPEPWRASPVPPAGRAGSDRRHRVRALLDRRGDVLVAAAAGLAIGVEVLTSSRMEGSAVLNVAGVVAIATPLAFLRRAPIVAAACTLAAATLHSAALTPLPELVTPIVLLLVPYAVAAYVPLRGAVIGLVLSVIATILMEPAVPVAVVDVLAWVAGRVVRDRSLRVTQLRAIADELEHARDAHRARVRGEERLRVARELHDAIAHTMTVVVLQAGAAQRVWERDRDAAFEAVGALGAVAREILGDLRVTLRSVGDDVSEPTLEQLDALVERVRPLGLEVRLVREANPAALPAEVDRIGFRVLQEALTNAVRHAAPTTVEVRVHRLCEELRIDVVDSGRSGDPEPGVAGGGHGLRGIAERVEAHGGEVRYGPAGRGFGVHVRLPLKEAVAR